MCRYDYLYRCEPVEGSGAEEFCLLVLKDEFEAGVMEDYQLGKTGLFLREAFYQHLEQRRLDVSLFEFSLHSLCVSV